jgi:hypothetical protein
MTSVLQMISADDSSTTDINDDFRLKLTELPFITWYGLETEHPFERLVFCNLHIHCHGNACLLQQPCASSRCPAMDVHSDFTIPAFRLPDTFLVMGTCIVKLWPAMDYTSFQVSCHIIILRTIHNVTAVSLETTMRAAEIWASNNNHLVVRYIQAC